MMEKILGPFFKSHGHSKSNLVQKTKINQPHPMLNDFLSLQLLLTITECVLDVKTQRCILKPVT